MCRVVAASCEHLLRNCTGCFCTFEHLPRICRGVSAEIEPLLGNGEVVSGSLRFGFQLVKLLLQILRLCLKSVRSFLNVSAT